MQTRLWMTATLAVLLLAACGQATTPPSTQSYDQFGEVLIYRYAGDSGSPGAYLRGNFERTSPFTAPTLPPVLFFERAPETCALGNTYPDDQPVTTLASLDAGSALNLHAPGTLATSVPRQVTGSGSATRFRYAADLPTSGFAGLLVSVPGSTDGFAAIKDAPLPTAYGPIAVNGPSNLKAITAGATFSWGNPSNASGALVRLEVEQTSPAVSFNCYARDDGSFTIPTSFQNTLSSAGFTSGALTKTIRATFGTVSSAHSLLLTAFADGYYYGGGGL